MELIELKDLQKTYYMGDIEVPVLKGITLSIDKGEFVALMGASGSGKSTLMNILGCLDHATSGEYWLEGTGNIHDFADERAFLRNHKIGFVFQNFNLLPRTSALENVIMPLSYTREVLSDSDARQKAVDLLNLVGLGDRMHYEPSKLSGGQQQRVAMRRALVNNPSVVFADEPTGNLDSKTSEEVLKMLQNLNEQRRHHNYRCNPRPQHCPAYSKTDSHTGRSHCRWQMPQGGSQ